MKKCLVVMVTTVLLSGCAPGGGIPEQTQRIAEWQRAHEQKMAEAKRIDAEFEQAVKNINLDTADVGRKPSTYKKLIETAIRERLRDPDSAKFYDFTPPRKEVISENHKFVYGYSSCVLVNAKNAYGGYTGKKLYWAFIRNDKVLRIKDTTDTFGTLIFKGRPINCT
ncbi:TPA: hypothetical protein N2G35_000585 [Salmonella enterica]|nr:hypothetical protein [Salmonella enterica]